MLHNEESLQIFERAVNPRKGGNSKQLLEVKLHEGESFDALLRRFTKKVSQEMVVAEIRRRQHFESPTSIRKKRAANKYRKSIKTVSKNS